MVSSSTLAVVLGQAEPLGPSLDHLDVPIFLSEGQWTALEGERWIQFSGVDGSLPGGLVTQAYSDLVERIQLPEGTQRLLLLVDSYIPKVPPQCGPAEEVLTSLALYRLPDGSQLFQVVDSRGSTPDVLHVGSHLNAIRERHLHRLEFLDRTEAAQTMPSAVWGEGDPDLIDPS